MIYFTTFIFALFLSHIARAVPACGDAISFDDLYDTYGVVDLVPHEVSWSAKYDDPNGDTSGVACSNGPHGLAPKYPHFKNFPDFPYIGGAFDTKFGSPNCGKCWKLTNQKTHKSIYFTAIDGTGDGFNIGKKAFIALNGGSVGSGKLDAESQSVPGHFCGFK
jgi:Cerato-platanin